MVITHDNALHCHLKQAHYSQNAPIYTPYLPFQTYPSLGVMGITPMWSPFMGTMVPGPGLAARCLIIIIIIFHLLSVMKIIICYN
jgi:hypothetical protein